MQKLFVALGVMFVALGLASGIAERIFYNGLNEDGALQESFFLPLAFILLTFGLICLLVAGLRYLFARGAAR